MLRSLTLSPLRRLTLRLLPAPLRLRSLFSRLREFLPAIFFDPLRELILAAGQVIELAPHLEVVLESRGVERARFQGVAHGAARLGLVLAIAEVTMRGQFFYVFKGRLDAFFDVPQLQFAHARSVQNQRAVRERDQLAMTRSMLATVVVFADFLDLLPFETKQAVDQGRFAHARRPDQRDSLAWEKILFEGLKPFAPLTMNRADCLNRRSGRDLFRLLDLSLHVVAEVGLGQQDHGACAALPRDGQIPLDSSRVEILIERRDQKESVDVRADDLFLGLDAFGLAHKFAAAWQRGMNHRLVSAFDQAQRDPIADGGKVGAALGSAPQPAGDFGQHLASRGVDAAELVVFKRDASGHVALRGEFAEMRGEEIVPAVALQL